MSLITKKEAEFVLTLLKSPETDYNAHSISKKLNISPMGALKIAKRLEKERILTSKKLGKAVFYKVNLNDEYARQYVKLLLKREAEQAEPYLKVWISEIRKLKNADAAILFGSVLKKGSQANDIDVVLITNQQRFEKLKKEIEDISALSPKRVHPVFQTADDFENNIKKRDPVILNVIKGIVTFGEDIIIKTLK